MKWISKRYLNGEATAVLGIAVPQPIRLCRINAVEVKFEPDETLNKLRLIWMSAIGPLPSQ